MTQLCQPCLPQSTDQRYAPNMGTQSPVEIRFRQHVRDERDRRGWSQAGLAELLQNNGLPHILASTVAKIEAGDRAVRIDEAHVLAELLETSVDALLGRTPLDDGGNLATELRLARHAATKAQLTCQEVQSSLASTALALRTVSGRQPVDDAETLVEACMQAATALGEVDRLLGTALAEAGGLAQ
jgi:ribosome-binding protein aMBF1 (putative translation factor)